MKTFIKYSLLATSVLFFWFIFIICSVPNIWISELIVSFLPYLWIAYMGMLITLIIVFWVSKHKYNFYDVEYKDNKKIVYIHMIKASIILVIFLTFGYLTFNIYDFAFKKPNIDFPNTDFRNSIKIVTFNKLYTNNNAEQISDTFKSQNIDIIALSEVTESDKIIFIEKLKDLYPYYYFTTSDVGFDNAIFSKYELTYKKEFGTRKDLLLAGVKKDDAVFNLIVAHPNSPTSSTNMTERNTQIDELSDQILEIKTLSADLDSKIVVVGDLNTTPWSPIMKEFSMQNGFLYNVAQGQGLRFTWQITKSGGLNTDLPFVKTQIDHIFVTKNLKLESYSIGNSLGSDHKPIIVNLKY